MIIISYKRIINRTLFTGQIFIRNKELPICINCVHFVEHTNNYPYDPIPSDEQYGKCKKFGEVNMITGRIKYDLASDCRLNMNKCGDFGSEYTEKIKT
jgi:hypothetical protein